MSSHKGPKRLSMQAFEMIRPNDETGVSGTGIVLEGCVFSNGKCVTMWRSDAPCVAVWDNFEQFETKHITPHPANDTEIKWLAAPEVEAE